LSVPVSVALTDSARSRAIKWQGGRHSVDHSVVVGMRALSGSAPHSVVVCRQRLQRQRLAFVLQVTLLEQVKWFQWWNDIKLMLTACSRLPI
jgi:hypothetical protein